MPVVNVSFGAAATTAVTAANNVTVNINTAVMQLQVTVDSVRNLLSEATSLAQQEHVDLTQVRPATAMALFCHITKLRAALQGALQQGLQCCRFSLPCSMHHPRPAGHLRLAHGQQASKPRAAEGEGGGGCR